MGSAHEETRRSPSKADPELSLYDIALRVVARGIVPMREVADLAPAQIFWIETQSAMLESEHALLHLSTSHIAFASAFGAKKAASAYEHTVKELRAHAFGEPAKKPAPTLDKRFTRATVRA